MRSDRTCFSSHQMWAPGGASSSEQVEQVSSLGHQMSLTGVELGIRSHVWSWWGGGGSCTVRSHVWGQSYRVHLQWGPMSGRGRPGAGGPCTGGPMSGKPGPGVPCMVRPNASWVMVKWGPLFADRYTQTTENIIFPQLCWRVVKMMAT